MFKKLLICCLLLVSYVGTAQDLREIRLQYPLASENAEITAKIIAQLGEVNTSAKPVLLAYKGAVLTLNSKFTKGRTEKKEFFKEGVSLIETAIKQDSLNPEIRYLRLSVQENAPKFLGYHKNIEEDKQFLLGNYGNISSNELKKVVKEYILNSKGFDVKEKSQLQ